MIYIPAFDEPAVAPQTYPDKALCDAFLGPPHHLSNIAGGLSRFAQLD
jgi:hypothetical protein